MVTGILIEGIEANPSNTDLLVTLAAYYKDIEDNTNAKKYYEQARDEAQKLGNIQLVELLDVELSKF
jgi:Tfp pilus assembly protein PilF